MSPQRLHHLDALRALTLVLILPAHAVAIAGLNGGWSDAEASVFWLIHVFRVPLFFLLAGFFAALLLNTRGSEGLLRNRLVRIGLPLVVTVVLVVPGLSLMLDSVSAVDPRPGSEGLGILVDFHPHYVWFLWYLVILYCGALLVHHLLGRLPTVRATLSRLSTSLLPHPIAPLLLAIPCALLLYREPTWIAEAPAGNFVPRLELLAYFAIFFACGWALYAIRGLRDAIERRPGRYALLAAIASPPALALYLLQSEPAIGASRWAHLLALGLFSVATWSLTFGLLGASRSFLHEASPRLRYMADASYWIYLSHFPVMAALALVLFDLAMPNALRLPLLVVATFAIIYPAYGAFVRHTAIGRVLHGPRPRAPERRRARRQLTPPAAAGRRA
ncbi:MAG TPA: acyltransferase family protein [Solirubrobacterales bacterium]|jgi:peptidoglycan/LPS O-acetylase OafA/YrhL